MRLPVGLESDFFIFYFSCRGVQNGTKCLLVSVVNRKTLSVHQKKKKRKTEDTLKKDKRFSEEGLLLVKVDTPFIRMGLIVFY